MKMLPTTRLAVRAAVALIVVLCLTAYITLGHSWWAVLTVLLLVAPSWGENIQRSLKRFLMTVVGCSLGWGLYLLVGHHPYAYVVIILLCIFGMMYCMPTWYASAMFFAGILVVFLFGSLSLWDGALMWQRVAQTGIGAVVVIVASGLILPTFSRHNFHQQLSQILKKVENNTQQLLKQNLADAPSSQELSFCLQQLSADLLALQNLYHVVRYEMLFSLRFSNRDNRVLIVLEILGFYLMALQQAFEQLDHTEARRYFKPIFEHLATHINRRFEQIEACLSKKPVKQCPAWETQYLQEARAHFFAARESQQFDPETFISVSACLYYCRRLEAELTKLVTLLSPKGEPV